jgi:hypothetical protein
MGMGSAINNSISNASNSISNTLNPGAMNMSGAPTSALSAMSNPVASVAPTVAQSVTANAIAPTYKDPNSPAAQGKVWSETTGQWVNPGPNSGAMPSSDISMPIMASSATPMAANVSNPNTATLGTGQTSSPYQGSGNPYIQAAQATTMGNLYGAQAATQANRINQNTPYGSLNYTQGVDANGNPTWTANQQLSPELQALTQSSLAGLQASQANPMYGINPGQTYSEAIMSRLQPIQQQQQDRVKAQLANQGVVPGTEAYNRAQMQLAQQQNDQLTSAITGGMQTGLQAQQLQNSQAANIKSLANPNYINPYTQAAVAGPDYLGAYTTSRAADIAQQNAQAAKTANLQNGLFGLGSSAILGAGGIGNLGSSILGGATTLGGLLGLGSSAAPGLGQTTNWLGQVVTDPTYGQGGSALDFANQLGDPGNLLGI